MAAVEAAGMREGEGGICRGLGGIDDMGWAFALAAGAHRPPAATSITALRLPMPVGQPTPTHPIVHLQRPKVTWRTRGKLGELCLESHGPDASSRAGCHSLLRPS